MALTTIWSSTFNLDDWDVEDICYNFGIDADDIDGINNAVNDMNTEIFNDIISEYDIEVPEGLVVFGDAGRWDGRSRGVVSVDKTNLSDCIEWAEHWNDMDIFINDDKDLMIAGYHHDGTDYYTIRKWNSAEDKENGIEALENGTNSEEVKNKYTSSVMDIINGIS